MVCPSGAWFENRPHSTPSICPARNPKLVIVQWLGIGTHRIEIITKQTHYLNCLDQRFSNFLKRERLFFGQKRFVDHLTVAPFESKFINFVAYFNSSILLCYLARSVIGADEKYVTILICRLRVGKTIKIHWKFRYFGPLLWIRMVPGWVTGAVPDVQGKNAEKRRVRSALNPSFVAECRVGTRLTDGAIIFIKSQYWEVKWKMIVMCHFQTLRFSAILWYTINLNFIFSCVFF